MCLCILDSDAPIVTYTTYGTAIVMFPRHCRTLWQSMPRDLGCGQVEARRSWTLAAVNLRPPESHKRLLVRHNALPSVEARAVLPDHPTTTQSTIAPFDHRLIPLEAARHGYAIRGM